MSTVSVVTGANSGIGRATAIHLAAQGHEVYGTVRDPAKATKLAAMSAEAGVEVHLVSLDVTDDDSVHRGMAEVLERAGGRVDVLVNNAGVGGNATVEDTTTEQLAEVMNVNVGGALRCLHELLPGIRERREGVIVNVTSVVGRFASVAQAPYVASKWAFEGLSEELAHELAPLGIRVAIIEPGVTKSAIFAKNVDVPASSPDYAVHYKRMLEFYAAGLAEATDPFEVARLIYHAVTTDQPVLRYPCSWGGPELTGGRQSLSDETWVELGAAMNDEDYWPKLTGALGFDAEIASLD